jgi:hypothetical protein
LILISCISTITLIWIGPYEYEFTILSTSCRYTAEGIEVGDFVEFPVRSIERTIEIDITALEGSIDCFVLTAEQHHRKWNEMSYSAIYEKSNSLRIQHVVQIGDEKKIWVGLAGHNSNLTVSGIIVAKCKAYTTDIEEDWWVRIENIQIQTTIYLMHTSDIKHQRI